MSDDDNQTERHIDQHTLTQLYNADMVATRNAAEERGAIASRIKGLQESHHLDINAYRIAKGIAKQPAGKREQLKRAVDLYCDMLGVGEQGDIEDVIKANVQASGGRTDMEAMMDGEPRGTGTIQRPTTIARPDTPAGDAAIATFKAALEECVTVPACNEGLDRFSKDNPYLADKAASVAIARITAIELADSDGDDVRPDHLKNAGATEAKQIAEAAKTSTRRKPGKAPPAKADKAATPKPDKPKTGGKSTPKAAGASVH